MSDTLAQEKDLSPLKRALVAVQDLTSRLEAAKRAKHEPIAIVGMACRFPGGANDPESFWSMLREGRDGVGEVPADRWDVDAFFDPDPDAPGKMYTRAGGFLDRPVDRFDARFFEIAPREATSMDPQQRLLLELAWEGLEDAGLATERVAGSKTGVFVGISAPDFNVRQLRNGSLHRADAYSATGNAFSVAAGRISYLLGLQGPNVALDTACSSSLVAVSMAVQSLRDGQSDMALAGGVNLMLAPETTVGMCKLRALAPDGRCKTFDAEADGYVRGEGGGIIVLKRLSDAVTAGDRIHAVIRGVAVNHDGRSSGLTVPNAAAQQAVLRSALADAGLAPEQVDYLEAHGTGTELGDPIEIRAAGAVLGHGRTPENPLAIGSVKTNIGHLEAAAGIAGLIKLALSLEHGEIPPHLHLREPTPHVDWAELPLVIPTERTPWPRGEKPRVAGVSSFGFSGTNAHILLEEAPAAAPAAATASHGEHGDAAERPLHLLPLSARSEPALRELARRYATHLYAVADDVGDVCHTAAVGRSHWDHRLAVAGGSADELRERLEAFVAGQAELGVHAGEAVASAAPRIAFLFTGHGAQFLGMARGLWDTQPVFRAALRECDALLLPYLERALLSVLFAPDENAAEVEALLRDGMTYSQPALFAVEYALAQLWRSWGIQPSVVLGHSVGEYVAATIAGVFDLADGLKLVAARGRLMDSLPGNGTMLAVFATEAEVEALIASHSRGVTLAVVNAPTEVVVSGTREALETFAADLHARTIEFRWLAVAQAAHSHLLDPILDEFERIASTVKFRAPATPLVSCTTARPVTADEIGTAAYWRRHLREPVRFAAAVERLQTDGVGAYLEVGPHPTLLSKARQCVDSATLPAPLWLPSLRRGADDWVQLLDSLGALYAAGIAPDWDGFDRGYARRRVGLPTYPFQGERFWPDESPAVVPHARQAATSYGAAARHPLLGRRLRSPALREIVFETDLDLHAFPLAADHRVFGAVVLPATGYVEAALAAAREALGWDACEIVDLAIRAPLILDPETGRTLQVILSGAGTGYAFRIASVAAAAGDDAEWTEHAAGELRPAVDEPAEAADLDHVRTRYPQPREAAALYESFDRLGIGYGHGFRGVEAAWSATSAGGALGRLRIGANGDVHSAAYRLHPGLLDSCLQLIAASLPEPARSDESDVLFLPTGFDRLRFSGTAGLEAWAEVRMSGDPRSDEAVSADVRLCDDDGRVVAEIHGLRLTRATRESLIRQSGAALDDWLFRMEWRPVLHAEAGAEAAAAQGTWLVLADRGVVGERLARRLETEGGRAVLVRRADAYERISERIVAVDPTEPAELDRLLADAVGRGPVAGVLHLWSLDEPADGSGSLAEIESTQRDLCSSVLGLVQAFDRLGDAAPGVLRIVTRGAQNVEAVAAPLALASASLWGLGRTVMQEFPGLRFGLLDLDPETEPDTDELFRELISTTGPENQVALRASGRFAVRLVPNDLASTAEAGPLVRPNARSVALEIPRRGMLENLELRAADRRRPGPGEVEIRVRAAGLNFRDVLNALGTYPGDAGALGGECAGEVVTVGEGVDRFRVGDRVFGMAGRAFAEFATTREELLAHVPGRMRWEEAAAIPTVFLTAQFALRDVGSIRPGDRVLVHAAAGGVGLAALQVAHAAGAEVLATAGSERKRRLLRSLGVRHVMDSRSADFADEVLRATDGRGVDIVLNSLSGDLIPAGFGALAQGGRFLEIGKLGIWTPEQAARHRPDAEYHVIDLIRVCVDEPARVERMLTEIVDGLDSGVLRPLPMRVFALDRAVDAFRFMAQARHVGKVVLVPGRADDSAGAPPFRADATYLVTGGLGGLGLAVARWMAENGAGRLALLGRREPSPSAREAIRAIEALGAEVVTVRADVADRGALAAAIDAIDLADRPLCGVVHSAGVLDDATLPNLDWGRFGPVLAPKVAGAWNLHELTLGRPLDFLVLFSSVTSILGSAGQGNYAVANAFLDALAQRRRSQGLPAQSLNWAAWSGVGLAAARGEGLERRLAAFGIDTISPDLGCRALGVAMRTGATQVAVLPLRRHRFAARFRPGTEPPVLSALVGAAAPPTAAAAAVDPAGVRRALEVGTPAERRHSLVGYLQARLARVLGLASPAALRPDRPLSEWGVDSLMVVELRNAILNDLAIDLPARSIFDAPDLVALAGRLEEANDLTSGTDEPALLPVPRDAPLPLSFAQQRLWFLQQLDPESTVFNIVATVRLRGALDVRALERGLDELVRRHEVLRTVFVDVGGSTFQVAAPAAAVGLGVVDLGGLAAEERDAGVQRRARDEAQRLFDLRSGPLLRAALLRLEDTEHALLLAMHHIATDGWSVRMMLRELGALYDAFRDGSPSPLPEPTLHYADFAQWQPEWLRGDRAEQQLAYWKRQLADLPQLQLPTDRPRPPVQTHNSDSVEVALSPALSAALIGLGRQEGATPFMVLLSAFQLLLGRLSGQHDVVVGSPVAGRTRTELETLVGFFVNNLVLRTDLAGEPSFRGLLARVRETTLSAYANQDLPFERLVEELNPPRDLSRTPLFQVMFNLLPTVGSERRDWGGVEAEVVSATNADAEAKFDLTLFAVEGERIRLRWVFNSDLFDGSTIARFADSYVALLESAVAVPDQPVAHLAIMSPAERRRLLVEWNETDREVPADATLHRLFERQAERTPDAPALTFERASLTYAELDRRANRLARHLQALGVGAETRVAIALERSPELVVAILATLKAGGAWVPIEPGYPAERVRWMLADSAAPVLVTDSAVADTLPDTDARVVRLDAEAGTIDALTADAPPSAAAPDTLAYVIYTSGSTGRPKGAMVEHRGVCNRLLWQREAYAIDRGDVFLHKTPIGFDVSVWEIFVPLISGARLVIARPGGHLDPEYLLRTVDEQGVTTVQFVPSVLRLFLDAVRPGTCGSLRQVFSGGEALSVDLQDRFFATLPAELHNLYGPTETSGAVTRWTCERGSGAASVPIGRPVANTRVYVLDRHLQPVPFGVSGELCVAGVQVGRGYLNQPELSSERFLPDPFADDPTARLYRTGDLARWTAGGALEFLGRIDDQVKLRGVRIEPCEIEAVIRAQPGVRSAAVVAADAAGEPVVGGSADRLIAFVVADAPLDHEDLRARLAALLPAAMLPSGFVRVDALPLSPNGKLDRRALLAMVPDARPEASGSVAPRTPLEQVVASAWSDVLGVERVGVHDGFYALGGHSLLAMQVVSRLRSALDAEVPLRLLFEAPTVAELAARIEPLLRAGTPPLPPLVPAARTGEPPPLSFAQQRLWFLQQMEPDSTAYNLAGAVRLGGELDADALERSFREVVRRHEALRTVFVVIGREPRQRILDEGGLHFESVDLRHLAGRAQSAEVEPRRAAESGWRFDLSRGPLLRAVLLRLGEDEHVLLVTMHHIVTDGWSVRVLLREMAELYSALRLGGAPQLPELPVQYADHALWQREWLSGDALESRLGFWRAQLADVSPLELPTDRPRPRVQSHASASVSAELSREASDALVRLSRAEGATPFMTLLAALQLLLGRLAGQERFAVGVPIAGRTRGEVEGLIGFFVNTLALRADLSGDPSFRDLLARVRETTLSGFANQDLPFEKLVEDLAPERDLARTPLVQVLFNMLPDAEHRIELDGLDARMLEPPAVGAKFDFTLYVAPAERLRLELVYNTDLFDEPRMLELLRQFESVLTQVVADPDRPLARASLVTGDARRRLPDPRAPLPPVWKGAVTERLRRHARHAPARPAAADAHYTWSYADLDDASDRLGHRLIAGGVARGDVVAVHARRGAPLLVALIGVWKAGAAFTILDASYPPARLAACARQVAPRAWIDLDPGSDRAPELAVAIEQVSLRIGLPMERDALLASLGDRPAEPVSVEVGPDDLAYVAFTSGTTGDPKGILGTHGPLSHFLAWHAETFELGENDRFGVLSGLAHDPLLRDVFAPIWVGGVACLPASEVREDPWALATWLRGEQVSAVHLTPAMADALVTGVPEADLDRALPGLRFAFFGGDVLRGSQVAGLRRVAPGVRCVNFYGATETPQAMGWAEVPADVADTSAVPLGHGIDGVQLLVLDAAGGPCGVGEVGEICVRTPYLARGYLGEPELTEARFVANPHTTDPADRIYRTGDRGRHQADGSVEFAGRADGQVKIRGYRVETAEVEAALVAHDAVSRALVLGVSGAGGQSTLAAFVVPADAIQGIDAGAMRTFLRARLPEFMVPATYIPVDSVPLTPNGKPDREALLVLASERDAALNGFVAPRTPLEELLAGVWQDLLGVERIGVHDRFFDIGGHSLMATQLVSRVRSALDVELPLRAVFEAPTMAGLAEQIDGLRASGSRANLPALVPVPRDVPAPLSFGQQRLWFLHRMEPGSTAFNIRGAVRLTGPLDRLALQRSFAEVARRHASLRTVFREFGGEPRQIVLPDLAIVPEFVPLDALPAPERDAETVRHREQAAQWTFDLEQGPLLRAWLLRLGEDEHMLLVTMHHIITDGWSLGLLNRELQALYSAFAAGESSPLPKLQVQYVDFAAWQRESLTGPVLQEQLSYWRGQLRDVPTLELQADRPRPAMQTYRGAAIEWDLEPVLSDAVRRLAQAQDSTLFMTLLAAFEVLLGRLSGQEDFAVGTPIAGRTRAEIEPLIGFFLNNLALRADLSGDPSFRELLARVREVTLAAFAHQDVPFERLIEELRPPRDLSRTPFFQVLFNMLPDAVAEPLDFGDVRAEVLVSGEAEAKFDLTLYVIDGERIRFRAVYNRDLFDAASVERMLRGLEVLLASAVECPERRVSTLPLLGAAEAAAAEAESEPRPAVEFEPVPESVLTGSIGHCFAGVVRRSPQAVAVQTAEQAWSYRELEERSTQIAHALLRICGVGEQRVALLLGHDASMVAGVLGVLKAGKTYVPLDPHSPAERLRRIVEDAEPTLVLSDAAHQAVLAEWAGGVPVLTLEQAWSEAPAGLLGVEVEPDTPAYILYTSGSTGEPKGVVQSHRNVLHHMRTYANRLHLHAGERVSLLSSYGFDAAVMDFFGALLTGATLCPIDVRSPEGADLPGALRRHGVTVYHSTPTLFRHLVGQLEEGEVLEGVRLVVLGGEAVGQRDVEAFRTHCTPGSLLVNGLGPTECTLALQQWIAHETRLPRGVVPVGRAVEGVEVLLVNADGEEVQTYAVGEIVLRSRYLALGYWRREEQTAAAFSVDVDDPEVRLYRTGDTGRRLPDGILAFVGRRDAQVKLRGYRIETGEVEAALLAHPAVREAAVLAREVEGEPQLVGYVVPAEGQAPSAAELRAHVRTRLPEYMVPAAVAVVEAIPLTANGKVDRRALLALEAEAAGTGLREAEAPRTVVEEVLAGIWQDVLGVERIGIGDDFYEMGGHSLRAMRLTSRVRTTFGVELPLREVFDARTVATQAERVETLLNGGRPGTVPPLVRVERTGSLPLSFAQQRLWFLQRLDPGSTAFNIHGAVRLRGPLDASALEQTFQEIVRRHESLRTVFCEIDGEPRQTVLPIGPDGFEAVDLFGLSAAERVAELERFRRRAAGWTFDLGRGPLLRVWLLRLAEDEHVLVVAMHHIVTDGTSMRVLFREIQALYPALCRGEPSPLPDLPIQYADHSVWQQAYLSSEVVASQLGYWRDRLAELPTLELPTDRPRPAVQTRRGAASVLELSGQLSERLRRLSGREGATPFMTLLAGFQVLLGRLSGQVDFAVGTPIAGRTHAEIEPLIGFFLNNLALRTDLSGVPTFRDVLARVRESALGAYQHQDVPFERLIEELLQPRDTSRTPFFQVLFNMLPELESERFDFADLRSEVLGGGEPEARFDLTLYVVDGERVRLRAVFNTDLFDTGTVERMLGQYLRLLEQVVESPETPVAEHTLRGAEEAALLPDAREPLVPEWPGSVVERLRTHAERSPEAVAVRDGWGAWSYAELEQASARLGARLAREGVGRGDVVALHAQRSASLVVALLGVWRAGAAFVILDAAYPADRLRSCLRQAAPRVVLTMAGALPAGLVPGGAGAPKVLDLPAAPAALRAWLGDEAAPPPVEVEPQDVAYVAFTSGTTGEPKGIVGTHGPLSHFLAWQQRTFGLGVQERVSVLSGLSHDPLLRDLFAPLWSGGTACVPAEEVRQDAAALFGWLARERVTLAHVTPSMAEVIVLGAEAEGGGAATLPALRRVFFGGERLRAAVVERLRRVAPGVECVNFYGATETPQAMGWEVVGAHGSSSAVVPLGRGIEGVQLLVVNAGAGLCGVGEVGEIWVRTPYLAAGYLADEERTAERFVASPFTGEASDRVYRTGDRGRYLPDGRVEYAGRADEQLKVRGYRVEPAEVEAVLETHPAVRRAAVVGREAGAGEVELVALVVAAEGEDEPGAALLREHLRARLPEYLVPSRFAVVDVIPLSANGKVDRRALLALEVASAAGAASAEVQVEPRTPLEEVLVGIWQDVLGVERLGVRDDFYELGGHSLLAMRLASRIRSVLGVEVPLRSVFERPTVAEQAEHIAALLGAGGKHEIAPLVRVERTGPLPLSFAQQRLWFLQRLDPRSTAYNLSGAVRLRGALDVAALERAFGEVVRRHESLRTVFREVDGEPVQVVLPESPEVLEVVDLGNGNETDLTAAVDRARGETVRTPFDLERGPLFRARLLGLAEDEHVLVIAMHHIVTDGTSMRVLTRELLQLYAGYASGTAPALPELEVQYADYAVWQREQLSGELLERQVAYWRERLTDVPALALPTERVRPAVQTHRGAAVSHELSADLSAALRRLGRREGATPFMTLLAGFQLLLSRLSGQEDVVVGTPIAGRTRAEIEPLIGFFLNNLALRTDLSGDPSFRDVLARVRETTLGAFAHQDVPFERLIEELQPPRDASRTPFFQVLFNLLPDAVAEALDFGGVTAEVLGGGEPEARFDLTLYVVDGERIRLRAVFNTDLFDTGTVERMLGSMEVLLAAAVERPERRVSTLPMLGAAEIAAVRPEVRPAVEFEPVPETVLEGSIGRRFREVAGRAPEAVAVRTAEHVWSYADLERRSTQIAHAVLRACGAGEQRVALFLGHNTAMVAGLLGVLEAGKTYVPLDPFSPEARIRQILDDSDASAVVTDRVWAASARDWAGARPVMMVEDAWAEEPGDALAVDVLPDTPAYILYTSGSTGEPKGVVQSHRNVLHHFRTYSNRLHIRADDRLSLFAAYGFDAAVMDIFGALLNGATLYPIDLRSHTVDLPDALRGHGITIYHSTPTIFRHLVDQVRADRDLESVRLVVLGGEEAVPRDVEAFRSHFSRDCFFVNGLGPTECTLALQQWVSHETGLPRGVVPVGRAVDGVEVLLLNVDGEPVETYAAGEIVLRSPYLALGYWKRDELTRTVFLPDPDGGERRVYHTGDLGRRLPDGSVEFLGRADAQVKIRGYRIETGEVEAVLSRHPALRQAVVLPREVEEGRQLVGYVVIEEARAAPTAAELRAWVREALPEYMVPAAYAVVERIPLSANGKVDRRALLALAPSAEVRREFAGPETPMELLIAGLWKDLLEVEQVAVDDNFYDLGGHSLLAVRFASRFQNACGVRLDLRELTYQTLGQLAATSAASVAVPLPTEKSGWVARLRQRWQDATISRND